MITLKHPAAMLTAALAACSSTLTSMAQQAVVAGETVWVPSAIGDWFDITKWDNGVPDATTQAFISDGQATIASGAAAAEVLWVEDNGIVELTGGSLDAYELVVHPSPNTSSARFTQTGGALSFTAFGVNDVVEFQGGTVNGNVIYLGSSFRVGQVEVSGTADITLVSLALGIHRDGFGAFTQNGGVVNIDSLRVGDSGPGQYELNSGILTSTNAKVGDSRLSATSGSTFIQSGGEHEVTTWLEIDSFRTYQLSGGVLRTPSGGVVNGNLEFASGSGELEVGQILNLSNATISDAGNTTLNVLPGGLVIFPAGFDPVASFGTINNAGLLHVRGNTLTIAAGTQLTGRADIQDRVHVAGEINSNWITLRGGFEVVPGGSAQVHIVEADGGTSTITGGSIQANTMRVGFDGDGVLVQTGGAISIASDYSIATFRSTVARHELSGGSILAEREFTVGHNGSRGELIQTGGSVTANNVLNVGRSVDAVGYYAISGGSMTAERFKIGFSGNGPNKNIFEVIGSDAILTVNGRFTAEYATQLVSHITEDGLSTIYAFGQAEFYETSELVVIDDGALPGRYNVLSTPAGITFDGGVVLPGPDWSWGIDPDGETLYVVKVPEPSSLALLTMGGALFTRKRRSLIHSN